MSPDSAPIGGGKTARRAYHLDDVSIVPSRRTRGSADVSTRWQIDAFGFDIPLVAHPSDATMSPRTAIEVGRLGGLGVLDAEGLWTRHDDPRPLLADIWPDDGLADPGDLAGDLTSDVDGDEEVEHWVGTPTAARLQHAEESPTARLQRLYSEPVKPELIGERIRQIRDGGVPVAVRLSPQNTVVYAPVVLDAGVDLLVIQGTLVSAEHVSAHGVPLNLKQFIADLDVPVVVGGASTYQTALHLMRTGAAGVIAGMGADEFATSEEVLGIGVPMATVIADAAAARRDYLDETGGRYVHIIADGEIADSGQLAKAIACGADAVMLGSPLASAAEAPAGGAWWRSVAAHPKLPRGMVAPPQDVAGTLEQVLLGPASDPSGETNLFGGLRRAMAKTGYSDLKEFQKVSLVTS